MRPSKVDYYLGIARKVAERSPCSRRKFGAILVKNDDIIGSGYNGTVRGALNCGIDIPCLKDLYGEAHYTSYSYCPAVHAEENVIIATGREKALGSSLYLSPLDNKDGDRPCFVCRKKVIQGGVKDCYYLNREGAVVHEQVSDWVKMEDEAMTELLEKVKPNWKEEMLK